MDTIHPVNLSTNPVVYKEDFEQFGHVAYDFQLCAFEAGLVFPLEAASNHLATLIEEVNERASRVVPDQLQKLSAAEGVDLERLMAHPGGDLCAWFKFERDE